MNYKLAKKLKDAGFPQKKWEGVNLETGKKLKENEVPLQEPTLSELIEACGDRFFSLKYVKLHAPEAYPPSKRIQQIREGNFWVADGEQCWTTAKTPEIVMTKLWLKLQLDNYPQV